MYKRTGLLTACCFIFLLACKKNSPTAPVNNKGDVVVGSYFGMLIPAGVNATASVSKVSTNQYRFNSNSSFPSFNFRFDTSAGAAISSFLTRDIYYIVPAQNTGSQMIDSTAMTFYTSNNVLDVQLTEKATNTRWTYGGKKQ